MNKHLSFVVLAISLSACGSSQTPLREVAEPDTAVLADQAVVDAKLKQRQITYDDGRAAYTSDHSFAPCDQGLLSDLKDAEALIKNDDAKLQPSLARLRGDALALARRVSDSHASLEAIRSRLAAYCEADQVKQGSCLPDQNDLAVRINENVAGSGVIHPYLRLDPKNDISVFIYTGDTNIRTTEKTSAYPVIAELISPADLSQLSACLGSRASTELGLSVATMVKIAKIDTDANCASLQQKNKNQGLRSGFPAENVFCGIKTP